MSRRLKNYSAQSGYVYEYEFLGYRATGAGSEEGTEYVFQVSPDRKRVFPVSVLVPDAAVSGWEEAHERSLTRSECYAIAKMALFQAFDERPNPDLMPVPVRVRSLDVDWILEKLRLD